MDLCIARLAYIPLRTTFPGNFSLKLGNLIRTSFITVATNGAWTRAAKSITIGEIIGLRLGLEQSDTHPYALTYSGSLLQLLHSN